MEKFLNQLNALQEALPPMKKAVENIKKDCRTPDQPHGNIHKTVLDLICDDCHNYQNNGITHLEKLVRSHRSIEKPDLFQSIPFIDSDEYLRRVCSLQNFVRYHLLGKTYNEHEMADVKKRDLQERLSNGELDIGIEELKGTTGKIGNPTWWTFKENGDFDDPSSGEAYMKELALGYMEMELAAAENTVIELSIERGNFHPHLYKPTALDAFSPETLFEPELSGKKYGYTFPQEDGLQSRPELVSVSISYLDLKSDTKLKLKKYPYYHTIKR